MITVQLLSTEGSRMTGQLNLFEVMLSGLKYLLGQILPSQKLRSSYLMFRNSILDILDSI